MCVWLHIGLKVEVVVSFIQLGPTGWGPSSQQWKTPFLSCIHTLKQIHDFSSIRKCSLRTLNIIVTKMGVVSEFMGIV